MTSIYPSFVMKEMRRISRLHLNLTRVPLTPETRKRNEAEIRELAEKVIIKIKASNVSKEKSGEESKIKVFKRLAAIGVI